MLWHPVQLQDLVHISPDNIVDIINCYCHARPRNDGSLEIKYDITGQYEAGIAIKAYIATQLQVATENIQ